MSVWAVTGINREQRVQERLGCPVPNCHYRQAMWQALHFHRQAPPTKEQAMKTLPDAIIALIGMALANEIALRPASETRNAKRRERRLAIAEVAVDVFGLCERVTEWTTAISESMNESGPAHGEGYDRETWINFTTLKVLVRLRIDVPEGV